MNDSLALALMAGMVLGTLFLAGLWWTVRKGVSSRHPAAWFLGSLLLRTGLILAGFHVVSGGQGDRLLSCLLGFLIARFFIMRFTGPPVAVHRSSEREAGHAP
jgi:F1F0 ATPase subunit 2